MTPVAIVGDIHGDNAALAKAVEYLQTLDRQIVFVGDYVDRGPSSSAVLARLIEFQLERPGTRFLAGNHEMELLNVLAGGPPERFLASGGLLTVRSYSGPKPEPEALRQFVRDFPKGHLRFLQSLDACFETDTLLVSHAGYDPDAIERRDFDTLAVRSHPAIFSSESPGPSKFVVCGHYVQRRGPFLTERLACIDTGCGTLSGAPLTVLLFPEMHVQQFEGSNA